MEFSGGSTAVLGTHFRLLTFKIVLFPESFCDIFSLAALSFSPRNLTYKKDSFPLARTQERLGHIPHVLCFLPGNVSFSFFLFFFKFYFQLGAFNFAFHVISLQKSLCCVRYIQRVLSEHHITYIQCQPILTFFSLQV